MDNTAYLTFPIPDDLPQNQTDPFVIRNGLRYAGTHLLIDLWGGRGIDDMKVQKAMAELNEMADLELIVFEEGLCRLTDEGLRHIGEMQNLKLLMIDGTQISDDGLQHLMVFSRALYAA